MAVEVHKFTVAPTEMVYTNGISRSLSLRINFMWKLLLSLISTESRLLLKLLLTYNKPFTKWFH